MPSRGHCASNRCNAWRFGGQPQFASNTATGSATTGSTSVGIGWVTGQRCGIPTARATRAENVMATSAPRTARRSARIDCTTAGRKRRNANASSNSE
jgi:hypothetical protein